MKHLLLDLDGTLWDYDTNLRTTIGDMFENIPMLRARTVDADEFYRRFVEIGRRSAQLRDYVFGSTLGLYEQIHQALQSCNNLPPFNHEPLLVSDMTDYIGSTLPRQTVLIEGAKEMLHTLRHSHPDVKLSIISNGQLHEQRIKLRRTGIEEYFHALFCPDNIGCRKPNKQFYNHVVQKLRANKDDCIAIGESYQVDIIGASKAGIRQIYFNPTRKSTSSLPVKPTYIIGHLRQVPEIIKVIQQEQCR